MSDTTPDCNRAQRRRFITWAAAGAALVAGLPTLAQARDGHHDGRGPGHSGHGGPQRPQPQRPGHAHSHSSHGRPHPGARPQAHAQRPWRGSGPEHRWHRGDRVPARYRSHQYVVKDWRRHRLSAPPSGYHWVQYGGDYLLVAIATGVITQLILSR